MELKLRAKLTAYSKLDITSASSGLPDASELDAGSVVGVGEAGEYELFPTVTYGEIDSLFDPQSQPTSVTKDEIDSLFDDQSVTKQDIDSLFMRGAHVNKI